MIGDYPMRKFEQEIVDVDIMKAILDRIDFAEVAAIDDDYPYVVPVNFGYEFKDDKLYVFVHGAGEGHKLDVWAKNDKVTVTFAMFQNHPHTRYRGAIHDYRCIMANGRIRPVSRGTEAGLWGHAVQQTLSHSFRFPNEFSVPHYMFMRMFVIECDMKNVSCKSEHPVYSPEEVDFPTYEELIYLPKKPDYDKRPALVNKKYKIAPAGKADAPCFEKELSITPIGSEIPEFTFHWDAPADGSVDADLYAYVRNLDGSISRRYSLVCYQQPLDINKALLFGGDDMNGGLAGQESVCAELAKLPESVGEVTFVLAMHKPEESGLDLASIGCVGLSVKDAKDGSELASGKLALNGAGKKAAVYAVLRRAGEGWELAPEDGKALKSWRLDDIASELGLKQWKE